MFVSEEEEVDESERRGRCGEVKRAQRAEINLNFHYTPSGRRSPHLHFA